MYFFIILSSSNNFQQKGQNTSIQVLCPLVAANQLLTMVISLVQDFFRHLKVMQYCLYHKELYKLKKTFAEHRFNRSF